MKYCPEFPSRFGCLEDGRLFCGGFFDYYNNAHRHSGLGLMTPAAVHYGRADELNAARRQVLRRFESSRRIGGRARRRG